MSRESYDLFVVAKHPELVRQVSQFVQGRSRVSTKHLRKKFEISGYLASVILRELGYVKFSKVNGGTSYVKESEE